MTGSIHQKVLREATCQPMLRPGLHGQMESLWASPSSYVLRVRWCERYSEISAFLVHRLALQAFPSPGKPLKCGPCRLHESERRIYSQKGLDGVLEELFRCIGVSTASFIEIGTQDGSQCSTRYMRVAHKFAGYMFDDGHEDSRIGLRKLYIRPTEIASLLNVTLRTGDKSRGVPPLESNNLDLLAIDTDGGDYGIWQALCQGRVKPRVVVLETNSNNPEPSPEPFLEALAAGRPISRHGFPPCPLRLLDKLSSRCGYVLVHTVQQDAVFVRRDVLRSSQPCRTFPNAGNVNFFLKREIVRDRLITQYSKFHGHDGASAKLNKEGVTFHYLGVPSLDTVMAMVSQIAS